MITLLNTYCSFTLCAAGPALGFFPWKMHPLKETGQKALPQRVFPDLVRLSYSFSFVMQQNFKSLLSISLIV